MRSFNATRAVAVVVVVVPTSGSTHAPDADGSRLATPMVFETSARSDQVTRRAERRLPASRLAKPVEPGVGSAGACMQLSKAVARDGGGARASS